jgi:putative ABC transport system ATP-binding protein
MLPLDFSKEKIKNKKQKAIDALDKVGMKNFAKNQANKLSGGQKQRVAIARAIVNQPSIILADEPTGALDSNTSSEIMGLFHELHDSGMTVIIVTHDMKVAKQCDRIIRIEDGKIIENS